MSWSLDRLLDAGRMFKQGKDGRRKIASKILKEVQLRLAKQHRLCLEMKDSIESEVNTNRNVFSEGTSKKPVIRAVTKNPFSSPKKVLMERKSLEKYVSDLEAMHADTYRLVWQLYPTNKLDDPAVIRNFTAPNETLINGVFEQIRSRHAHSVDALANIVILESKRDEDDRSPNLPILSSLFLEGRICVQLLCDHYVGLHKQAIALHKVKGYAKSGEMQEPHQFGAVSFRCDIWSVMKDAVAEASAICETNLGVVPEVRVIIQKEKNEYVSDESLLQMDGPIPRKATIVQAWAHHCFVEILKNSMQSSVMRDKLHPPHILVSIEDEGDRIKIRIKDNGIGLDDSGLEKAFNFARTGEGQLYDRLDHQQSYAAVTTPISGLGVGLPLSRLMMRKFGGDLILETSEKEPGVTASLYFNIK